MERGSTTCWRLRPTGSSEAELARIAERWRQRGLPRGAGHPQPKPFDDADLTQMAGGKLLQTLQGARPIGTEIQFIAVGFEKRFGGAQRRRFVARGEGA